MAQMPTLALGARGDAVVTLVSALTAAGFAVPGDPSIFGPILMGAVQAFQRDRALNPDGIVGPQTWDMLGYEGVPTPTGPIDSGSDLLAPLPAASSMPKWLIPAILGGIALWALFSGGKKSSGSAADRVTRNERLALFNAPNFEGHKRRRSKKRFNARLRGFGVMKPGESYKVKSTPFFAQVWGQCDRGREQDRLQGAPR